MLATVAAAVLSAVLLVACASSPEPAATSSTAGPAPTALADIVQTLEPRPVWEHFLALTQIPRPSGHEGRAAAYVVAHARTLNLPAAVDEAGNVLVRVPATSGHEQAPGVVLQAHLDMTPHATATATVDPATDGVHAVVENGWVRADGTSLGADDGIGVALILALLDDRELRHGPIEALFTVREEVGLQGAAALDANVLESRLLISVDQSREDRLTIGSAGAAKLRVDAEYAEQTPPAGATGLLITVEGLRGGHSGNDIGKGRASAIQLMARLLAGAPAVDGVSVASLHGGDAENAIARGATATAAVPAGRVEGFGAYAQQFGAEAAAELGAADPDLKISVVPMAAPARVMEPKAQRALLAAVAGAPQGVFRMSAELPDVVETSGNLGTIALGNRRLTALILVRSGLDEERDAEAQRFAAVFKRAGAAVTVEERLPGWATDPDSPLVALMKRAYKEARGATPTVVVVHSGLESSVIGAKYPGMDMVALGPTAPDYHTPNERLEVASVGHTYGVLATALERIGEQKRPSLNP